MSEDSPPAETIRIPKSPGFWKETWRRFRKNRVAMIALAFVGMLSLVAILSPAIAGTRPIVCKYRPLPVVNEDGEAVEQEVGLYFPALGYFNPAWENAVFTKDKFRRRYYSNLSKNDPESWAIWPLFYQDPYRRVRDGEFKDQPGNRAKDEGTPSWLNPFGTDQRGVDVFAQMVHGTRIALLVGFVSMGIAAGIGITVGAIAGFAGGWVDTLLSRLIEVVMCIPTLILILALIAILDQPTIWQLMAVIGCTGWTGIARLTRAEFLRLKESDFVAAARVTGVSTLRIIFFYILPNAIAPVLVPITFGIAGAILIESGLSYLGFGAPPPSPSWGVLLSEGRRNYTMWWLIVFPGLAIFAAVLSYNLIGEGLQEATDPRLRERE